MAPTDEKCLIRRTLNGDQNAFGHLYRVHLPRVYATVMGQIRNPDDIEDLVQLTFMRAFTALNTFRGESAFSTWLTRIALNTCLSHRRVLERRRLWQARTPESDIVAAYGPGQCPDPEADLHQKEQIARVRQCIRTLPKPYRQAAWLRYVKDQSYAEMTQTLQTPVGTVKTWLYRARQHLKAGLEHPSLS